MDEILLQKNLTASQRMLFQSEMNSVRKDRTTAFLLTFFLGGLGAHQYYMGNIGKGVLYTLFSWTFIPTVIAFIELFLIGRRVDNYNEDIAHEIVNNIKRHYKDDKPSTTVNNSIQKPNDEAELINQLEKLTALKEKGILTEDEFNQKKDNIKSQLFNTSPKEETKINDVKETTQKVKEVYKPYVKESNYNGAIWAVVIFFVAILSFSFYYYKTNSSQDNLFSSSAISNFFTNESEDLELIKKMYFDNNTTEGIMNGLAGIGGKVEWRIIKDERFSDNPQIIIGEAKAINNSGTKKIEITYQFMYDKITKQGTVLFNKLNRYVSLKDEKNYSGNSNITDANPNEELKEEKKLNNIIPNLEKTTIGEIKDASYHEFGTDAVSSYITIAEYFKNKYPDCKIVYEKIKTDKENTCRIIVNVKQNGENIATTIFEYLLSDDKFKHIDTTTNEDEHQGD